VFSTGHGRKTDATDAHSIAVVAVRTSNLNQVAVDPELVALRLLADRRDELAGARTRTANRLHRLLLELIPGGAPRFLSATQAKALLATVRPRDIAGRTRRQLAAGLLADMIRLDRQLKDSDQQLAAAVTATGSRLPDLYGIGPVGAARILGDVGDVARFQTKAHFASWTGTASRHGRMSRFAACECITGPLGTCRGRCCRLPLVRRGRPGGVGHGGCGPPRLGQCAPGVEPQNYVIDI
jgi:transposase